MKKLIDVAAINAMISAGDKVVYVDNDTLLTPAARDAIKNAGLEIQEGCAPAAECCQGHTCESQAEACKSSDSLDADLIFKVLSQLQNQGLLNGLLDSCGSGKPYMAECDPAGLKVVRGSSVRTEVLETGNPADNGKVKYQEIIGADDHSSMNAGFMTIDNCSFDWDVECQEIYYVVEGCITVTIGNKTYEAKTGDSLFIPKGIHCVFGTTTHVKVFYATY